MMASDTISIKVRVSELVYFLATRRVQKFPYWFASKMPRWLVYHCALRLMVNATTGEHSRQIVPELTAIDALKRWDDE